MTCIAYAATPTETTSLPQDTSNTYVRGEEALGDWRAHGEDLISDTQRTLDRLSYLSNVEDTRQALALSDKIRDKASSEGSSGGQWVMCWASCDGCHFILSRKYSCNCASNLTCFISMF